MKRWIQRVIAACLTAMTLPTFAVEAPEGDTEQERAQKIITQAENLRHRRNVATVTRDDSGLTVTQWQKAYPDGSYATCSEFLAPEGKEMALQKWITLPDGVYSVFGDIILKDNTPQARSMVLALRKPITFTELSGEFTMEETTYREQPCYQITRIVPITPEMIERIKEDPNFSSQEDPTERLIGKSVSTIGKENLFFYVEERFTPSGKFVNKTEYDEVILDLDIPDAIFELPQDRETVVVQSPEEDAKFRKEAVARQKAGLSLKPKVPSKYEVVEQEAGQ